MSQLRKAQRRGTKTPTLLATGRSFGTRLRTSVHGHTARLCAHFVFHAALCVSVRVRE